MVSSGGVFACGSAHLPSHPAVSPPSLGIPTERPLGQYSYLRAMHHPHPKALHRAAERDAEREDGGHTIESDEEEAGEQHRKEESEESEEREEEEGGSSARKPVDHGGGKYELQEEDLHEELDREVGGVAWPCWFCSQDGRRQVRKSDRIFAFTSDPGSHPPLLTIVTPVATVHGRGGAVDGVQLEGGAGGRVRDFWLICFPTGRWNTVWPCTVLPAGELRYNARDAGPSTSPVLFILKRTAGSMKATLGWKELPCTRPQ